MVLPERIKEVMTRRGLTQAELARRVGVRQPTIFKLASGNSSQSKFLHLIARELKTTSAYLTGETDDPDADAPPPPLLDHQETDLVDCFRVLTPADRAVIVHLVRSLAGGASEPRTVHSPVMEYGGRR